MEATVCPSLHVHLSLMLTSIAGPSMHLYVCVVFACATQLCAHAHTHTHTYMHTRTHAHTNAHAHTHACTHIHTRTHTHTHTQKRDGTDNNSKASEKNLSKGEDLLNKPTAHPRSFDALLLLSVPSLFPHIII